MVAGWRQYLLAERGMTPAAARGYTDVVRPFLAARDDGGCVLLDGLGAAEINAFMLGSALRFAPKTMQRLAKERAIARTAPIGTPAGRFQPGDALLAFLDSL